MSIATHLRALLPARADAHLVARFWRTDILAGLTVGIVALPLALAFSISSGLSASAGLITAIVAGVVAGVFGGSNLQISGPTGAMVVVLAPVVAAHGPGVVPLLAVLAGLLVLATGVLGLGRAVSLIPWPVVEGFTLGIATIIFLQQVPPALGTTAAPGVNAVVGALSALGAASWPLVGWCLLLAGVVAATTVLAPRLHPSLPGSLIGVVVATVLAQGAGLPVPRIGQIPAALPAPAIPAFSPELLQSLAGPAFAVALLAAIESLLSARVAAGMIPGGTYEPDRELFGQGLASIACSIFGGMPATGAIARTAVNVRSDGRSRLASIVHSGVLIAVVLLAANLVSEIPLAALAGVLMVTATRMTSRHVVVSVLRSTRSDALIFALTAVVTVGLDLIQAIAVGVAAAGIVILRKLSARSGIYREDVPQARAGDEHIAILRLDGAMFFGVSDRIETEAGRLTGVRVVIMRLSRVGILDATGARALADIVQSLSQRGITVLVKGLNPAHRELTERLGVAGAFSDPAHTFDDLDTALAAARRIVGTS